jgi:hypothetical protein
MPSRPVVSLSTPYPLLDSGEYIALCTEATFDWARQWKKWMARLILEPQNYTGRSFQGNLCKFLSLGKDPKRPFAGQHSAFRQLLVELNGAQPLGPETSLEIFQARFYEITVETVTMDRARNQRSQEHWYSIVREIHPAPSLTLQPTNNSPFNPSTLITQRTYTTDQHSNTGNTPLTKQEIKAHDSVSFEAKVIE